MLLAVAFAESVVSPVYNVALDNYRLARTPDHMRGRVTAGIATLVTGASALGAMACGALIAAFGPVWLTWALAGWLALLAIAATWSGTVRRAEQQAVEKYTHAHRSRDMKVSLVLLRHLA
ncbi:hypothetical protein L0U85_08120 [Glycomyces sp. L485]|nr:hypothetical protein [Glycomyces sp. L485]MCH7230814.1 hypothetical protein [Glycomyces sp. L485]